jgi:hypothetical protein
MKSLYIILTVLFTNTYGFHSKDIVTISSIMQVYWNNGTAVTTPPPLEMNNWRGIKDYQTNFTVTGYLCDS